MVYSNGPSIVRDGLVLHLDAADRNSYPLSGNTWYDLSGNGYNGTLTNGPVFNNGNHGYIGFDSTDDYIQLSESSAFNTNKFTIEMFLKTQEVLSNTQYYGFFSTINGNNGFQLFWHSSMYFYLYVGAIVATTTVGIISSNTWLHLAATYDASNLNNVAIYVNNTRYAGTTVGTYNPGIAPRIIGRRADSTYDFHFSCNFHYTRFYNRALSSSEVLQNYNATKGRFGL